MNNSLRVARAFEISLYSAFHTVGALGALCRNSGPVFTVAHFVFRCVAEEKFKKCFSYCACYVFVDIDDLITCQSLSANRRTVSLTPPPARDLYNCGCPFTVSQSEHSPNAHGGTQIWLFRSSEGIFNSLDVEQEYGL